ncbi:MAG: ABC transporter permease [Eubacteriaceae bacterium]|nr:ABC transporter permease [Eubacteriaceae bacterium]
MIATIAAIAVLVFFTVRLSPSDPIASITKGKTVSADTRQALIEQFHLDKSLSEQFIIWLNGMFHGDLGESYQYRQSVSFLIKQRVSTTLGLAALATSIAFALSIPIGIISAVMQDSFIDKALSVFALVFVASPTYLIAIAFMYIFALKLKMFPSIGTGTFRHLVLPASAMALNMVALSARITRQSMIDELQSAYMLTANAKGLSKARAVLVHALRNALIPVITIASLQMGGMLIGAVLVETVFAMGGLGDLLISSIRSSDYPVVQAITMLMVAIFMLLSLLVDILYAVIDPRVRNTA